MKNKVIFFLYFMSFLSAFSQEPPQKKVDIDELIDDFLVQDESLDVFMASMTNFHLLYVSLNYNSNTYFSGRDVGIDQYNLVPQLTYMHSKGFYASLSGIYYSEFEPNWDVTTTTVGFGKSFGKGKIWNYYTSFSYFFYANDIDNLYHSTVNGGIGISTKKRTLGTQLSGAYYFGDEVTYQIVLRSYANLKLLKTSDHYLRFRPQFSIVTGTQIVDLSGGSIQKIALTKEEDPIENPIIIEDNVFGLINTQINLPIQYSINSFDFELGFNYNIPSELGNETDLEHTYFFNVGVAYLFDL
ncbi:MAG: hypothetical protein WBN19_07545 [Lutimonas sp.]|jgi:hypothetical protein